MLSNTVGNDSDSNTSSGAVVDGGGECTPEERGDGGIYGLSNTKGAEAGDVTAQVFLGVAQHPDPATKEATFKIVGAGVVCIRVDTQGNAGGAAQISSSNLNCNATDANAQVYGPDSAVKDATFDIAGAGIVNGLCNNLSHNQQIPPSTMKSVLDSGAEEDLSSGIGMASVCGARTYNTKGLKKR